MRKLLIVLSIVAVVSTVFMFEPSTAQTTPPLDDNEYISRTESGIFPGGIETTLIGINLTTSEIWTLVFDPNDLEIVNRIANSSEIALYNSNKLVFDLANSYDNLNGDIAAGEKIENWINNRTPELEQCETDANDALALGNWNTLTNGVQNAIIDSLLTCQELNSRVNRKTINGLLDILVAEGIITLE